ncbi:hypothetical protein FOCC_FOCC015745 [Frankliniella occidentalis]|nr:hypothetical protein FOCC_FOCC015745 [Frankliniella occidentalis]
MWAPLQPGSVNDSRVFRRSHLAYALFTRNEMMGLDEHLVGDQGYAVTSKVLVPYRNNGHLTESHRYFNFTFSQCRSTVEQLSGHLKLRMQRLGKLYTKSIRRALSHSYNPYKNTAKLDVGSVGFLTGVLNSNLFYKTKRN